MSPFAHGEDSGAPFQEEVNMGKSVSHRMAGAEVVFRAVPGMTAEWLQRVVDCHLAHTRPSGILRLQRPNPACALLDRARTTRERETAASSEMG